MSIRKKEKRRKTEMPIEIGKVRLVRIPKVAKRVEHKPEKPPRVNPRVTPEEAVEVLKNTPGGLEVIKQLEKQGIKLP